MHDIALQNLHVVMVLDRAGLGGAGGPTHHGAFDLSYLRTVPGITILAPSNENELRDMVRAAIDMKGPVAIRYPRGTALEEHLKPAPETVDVKLPNELKKTAAVLRENGKSATVVDARIIKPLDTEAYRKLFDAHKTIVTLEDNTLVGGFGSAVAELIADLGLEGKRLLRFGLPDHFVEQGEIPALFKLLKIDGESVAKQIMEKV